MLKKHGPFLFRKDRRMFQMKKETRYSYGYSKPYSFMHLCFDVVMTILTGGLWLIVVVIQYLRTH